jgi:hypothetical protein
MKTFLLAAGLLLAGASAAQAQITMEHRYNAQILLHKLSNGTLKYAGYFSLTATTGQVRVYNLDHSLYRQVPVTLPASTEVQQLQYVSDNLFNTNTNLEMVLSMRQTSGNYLQMMSVIDETGTTILAEDSTAYPLIYNTPSGSKMVATFYTTGRTYSKIFALPGSYTPLRTQTAQGIEEAGAYPNPGRAAITLPYQVQRGQTGRLDVLDMTGRVVKTFAVDSTFDHLLLDSSELAAGTYVYRVTTPVDTSAGRRFVVER